jgi:hypothetical protein
MTSPGVTGGAEGAQSESQDGRLHLACHESHGGARRAPGPPTGVMSPRRGALRLLRLCQPPLSRAARSRAPVCLAAAPHRQHEPPDVSRREVYVAPAIGKMDHMSDADLFEGPAEGRCSVRRRAGDRRARLAAATSPQSAHTRPGTQRGASGLSPRTVRDEPLGRVGARRAAPGGWSSKIGRSTGQPVNRGGSRCAPVGGPQAAPDEWQHVEVGGQAQGAWGPGSRGGRGRCVRRRRRSRRSGPRSPSPRLPSRRGRALGSCDQDAAVCLRRGQPLALPVPRLLPPGGACGSCGWLGRAASRAAAGWRVPGMPPHHIGNTIACGGDIWIQSPVGVSRYGVLMGWLQPFPK